MLFLFFYVFLCVSCTDYTITLNPDVNLTDAKCNVTVPLCKTFADVVKLVGDLDLAQNETLIPSNSYTVKLVTDMSISTEVKFDMKKTCTVTITADQKVGLSFEKVGSLVVLGTKVTQSTLSNIDITDQTKMPQATNLVSFMKLSQSSLSLVNSPVAVGTFDHVDVTAHKNVSHLDVKTVIAGTFSPNGVIGGQNLFKPQEMTFNSGVAFHEGFPLNFGSDGTKKSFDTVTFEETMITVQLADFKTVAFSKTPVTFNPGQAGGTFQDVTFTDSLLTAGSDCTFTGSTTSIMNADDAKAFVIAGKKVTFESLTLKDSTGGSFISVISGGSLVINNPTMTGNTIKTEMFFVYANSSLIINGGDLTKNSGEQLFTFDKAGKVAVDGVKFGALDTEKMFDCKVDNSSSFNFDLGENCEIGYMETAPTCDSKCKVQGKTCTAFFDEHNHKPLPTTTTGGGDHKKDESNGPWVWLGPVLGVVVLVLCCFCVGVCCCLLLLVVVLVVVAVGGVGGGAGGLGIFGICGLALGKKARDPYDAIED